MPSYVPNGRGYQRGCRTPRRICSQGGKMTTNARIVIQADDVLPSAYHGIWLFLQKGKLEVPHFTAAPFRKLGTQRAKTKIAVDPIAFVGAPKVRNAFLLNIFQSDII